MQNFVSIDVERQQTEIQFHLVSEKVIYNVSEIFCLSQHEFPILRHSIYLVSFNSQPWSRNISIQSVCSSAIPSRPISFLRFNSNMKSLAIICLVPFDLLCCIDVYKAKWLNSECLNPSVKSKH